MIRTHSHSENDSSKSQAAQRTAQLCAFYQIKAKNNFIGRQMLFLGIAILDKARLKAPTQIVSVEVSQRTMLVRAAAALWIACKFMQNDHIPIAKLAAKMEEGSTLIEEIIEMESQILERIEYEVPLDHTYATMTRAYESTSRRGPNEKVVVSQCLVFLKEALFLSSDFSLCGQLGVQILRFVQARTIKDRRIKLVCASLHTKTQKDKQKTQKATEEILSK